jgi:hypothetical protein
MTKQAAPHVRTRQIRENSRIAGMGRGLNAHRMVAETAVKMAMEYWEVYMLENNELYRAFKANLTEKQMIAAWVAKIAPLFLEEARLALTDCLSQPDDVVSRTLKDEIFDALLKDTDFRANRTVAAQHAALPGMMH